MQWAGLKVDSIETMVYIKNGKAHCKSTAFFEVMKKLPAAWPLLSKGLLLPHRFRDWLYMLVAKNRYRIAGKKSHCLMPSESIQSRFIRWNLPS